MADIKQLPFVRHLRGTPTMHVRHLRRSNIVHDGVGQTFWFRPLTAVLSEVPIDDREFAGSPDHRRQTATPPGALSYRVAQSSCRDPTSTH